MRRGSQNLRRFFARYVSASAGVRHPRIEQAFAAVERERFAGPGPWSIHVLGSGYIETLDADPAFIYQDTLVALDAARGINIGQPSAHAQWLDALGLVEGETVVQVGAGSGYYTAILAHLVGPRGRVHAFEVDPVLADRARAEFAGSGAGDRACALRHRGRLAEGRRRLCMRGHNTAELDLDRRAASGRAAAVSAAAGGRVWGDVVD